MSATLQAAHDRPLKILFTEGSSTSARQSLYALGRLGHTIDVLDPTQLCLARFSRYVRRMIPCPSFTRDPGGYLKLLHKQLQRERYDVLLPTHDQVYLLCRFRQPLAELTGLALPEFAAIEQVQSKTAFVRLLDQLGLPQPAYKIVTSAADLDADWQYPCFVKQVYSTAGCGVTLVQDANDMKAIRERLQSATSGLEAKPTGELLVQQPAAGEYGVVQTVFQHGRLVGCHCYRARAKGVGGSAHARESVRHPAVAEHVATLGAALAWHGALHMEYFFDPDTLQPQYIEANPRIGETVNATLSGVNLCETLTRVSLEEPLPPPQESEVGIRTHSLLMALLAQAADGASRRQLACEMWQACRGRGVYHNSREELIRPAEDARSLAPAAYVTAQLLAVPARARTLIQRTVDNYSLSGDAIAAIKELPADLLTPSPPL